MTVNTLKHSSFQLPPTDWLAVGLATTSECNLEGRGTHAIAESRAVRSASGLNRPARQRDPYAASNRPVLARPLLFSELLIACSGTNAGQQTTEEIFRPFFFPALSQTTYTRVVDPCFRAFIR